MANTGFAGRIPDARSRGAAAKVLPMCWLSGTQSRPPASPHPILSYMFLTPPQIGVSITLTKLSSAIGDVLLTKETRRPFAKDPGLGLLNQHRAGAPQAKNLLLSATVGQCYIRPKGGMNVYKKFAKAFIAAIFVVAANAQEIEIGSIRGNGTMSFWGAQVGTTVAVEWAASLIDAERTNWTGLTRVVVTTDAMTTDIPMFFRVRGVPDTNLLNGLVAYWPFDGNANDATTNGNNGVVHGATLATNRFGVAGCAYRFDGNDDITVQHSASLAFSRSKVTFAAWINFSEGGTDNPRIWSKGWDAPNYFEIYTEGLATNRGIGTPNCWSTAKKYLRMNGITSHTHMMVPRGSHTLMDKKSSEQFKPIPYPILNWQSWVRTPNFLTLTTTSD